MDLFDWTDEVCLHIREHQATDSGLGGRHRLVGARVKQYAARLKGEMDRRRLHFKPIE